MVGWNSFVCIGLWIGSSIKIGNEVLKSDLDIPICHLQISRDCQELDQNVGEQLAALLYQEPDSDLMVFFLDIFKPCIH